MSTYRTPYTNEEILELAIRQKLRELILFGAASTRTGFRVKCLYANELRDLLKRREANKGFIRLLRVWSSIEKGHKKRLTACYR